MGKNKCLDCNKDISNRGWMAKRCKLCAHKRNLRFQKEYRNTHKEEIKEYQKKYYGVK